MMVCLMQWHSNVDEVKQYRLQITPEANMQQFIDAQKADVTSEHIECSHNTESANEEMC